MIGFVVGIWKRLESADRGSVTCYWLSLFLPKSDDALRRQICCCVSFGHIVRALRIVVCIDFMATRRADSVGPRGTFIASGPTSMAVPATAAWPLSISTSLAGVRAFAASLVLIAFCYTLRSLAYSGKAETAVNWVHGLSRRFI